MAGLRSKRLAFNAEAVERELLGGAGAMRPASSVRTIPQACSGLPLIAVDGSSKVPRPLPRDVATGLVSFLAGHIPPPGAAVAAGFEFDVPVRFATGRIDVNLSAFNADASRRSP